MNFRLHGSSPHSMSEARERMARREAVLRQLHGEPGAAAENCVAELAALAAQEKGDDYAAEIFEPTLETLSAQNIVTRNRYGAEVLNSTELCFVDVDHFPASLWERLAGFFGLARRSEEQRLLEELQHLHAEQEDLRLRLYRTAGGWRVRLAGEGLRPDSPRMLALFARLHADPAYVRLCRKQQCWRARLSPKPGRLLPRPGRYPRRSAADTPAEGEEEWLARYAEASEGLGVCRLVESWGATLRHPLVAWHDERTAALKDGLRLA